VKNACKSVVRSRYYGAIEGRPVCDKAPRTDPTLIHQRSDCSQRLIRRDPLLSRMYEEKTFRSSLPTVYAWQIIPSVPKSRNHDLPLPSTKFFSRAC
jgi:hypothetical protein